MEVYTVRHVLRDRWQALSREQQLSMAVFGVCGVLAMIGGVISIRYQISSPFTAPNMLLVKASAIQKQLEESSDEYVINQKRKKDSDHDGLSDYAEEYLYGTSPYLADSDSDGIPDPVEIAQRTDPNCPAGKTCIDPSFGVVSNTSSTAQDLLDISKVPTASSTASELPPDPKSMSTDEIRSYLLTHGLLQPEQSKSLDDDTLKQVYTTAYSQAAQMKALQPSPTSP